MSRLSLQKHPSYHLRPNKAVDRYVFIELLQSLELLHPLTDHVYIGLGGPFLEDFRILSNAFPKLELICIEKDKEIYKRQNYHTVSSNMTILNCTFEEYLATCLPSDRPVIIWADYTNMTREILNETSDIARHAIPWSIIRITVRAESPVYKKLYIGRRYPKVIPPKKKAAFNELQSSFKENLVVDGISYNKTWFEWESFSNEQFPLLQMNMILAVIAGSCSRPKTFIPLHAVKYSDGTIMLSITGIICHEEARRKIFSHFKMHYEFLCKCNKSIDEIDVPVLTTKERMKLDGMLPTNSCDGSICLDALGYLIDGDDSEFESRRKMRHYEKYYRLYPYFGKHLP